MIHDLDKTLENLIRRVGKVPEDIEINFDQPNREWSSRLSRPTLNLYAFDMRENLKLRPNMQRQVVANGNMGRTDFPVRRMDISYLVTAWARRIEDEHQLAWRALAVLKRVPQLDPRTCEGDLRMQSRPIPITAADMSETSHNVLDLWGVLDNQLRLGFLLGVTLELDIHDSLEAPLVLEASIRVGQTPDLPANRALGDNADTIVISPSKRQGGEP
jgi:hypothetical protein